MTVIWCGDHNFNESWKIRLKPGLHMIAGSININSGSEFIAVEVTFYFSSPTSKFLMNRNSNLTFTAPKSGTYAGIAMDDIQGLSPSQTIFNGFNGQTLSGLFNLPSRNVTFNSESNAKADDVSILVNQVIINSVQWNFTAVSEPLKRIIRKNVGPAKGGKGGGSAGNSAGGGAGTVPYLVN